MAHPNVHTHTRFYAGMHTLLLIGFQKFHLPVFVKDTPDILQTGIKTADLLFYGVKWLIIVIKDLKVLYQEVLSKMASCL